jgi:hypothetical protein
MELENGMMCLQMVLPFGYQYVCTAVRRDRYAITSQSLVHRLQNRLSGPWMMFAAFYLKRRGAPLRLRSVESPCRFPITGEACKTELSILTDRHGRHFNKKGP